MTRRVLAALLGLTVLILAGVVVPLGLSTADHDRQVFTDRTIAAATARAATVEEQLADNRSLPGQLMLAGSGTSPGDRSAVYNTDSQPLGPDTITVAPADLSRALAGEIVTRWVSRPAEGLLVLVPARTDSRIVGVNALLRPSQTFESEVHHLALGLAAAGCVALAMSALIGTLLARWVSRPLRHLRGTAAALGEGSLDVRATGQPGPPEIRELTTTFNEMATRIETLIRGSRSLLADVSHQLRTPLAAMRLRLELLAEEANTATRSELAAALTELHRLSRLVDGLLAVARAEQTTPTPTTVQVDEVAAERVQTWQPLASEGGIRLNAQTEVSPARFTAGHLEQILDNLLANAIQATPVGGQIAVDVTRHPDHIGLTVTDTGPGMSQEQRGSALGRFWTAAADADGRPGRGVGLGLAIVHRLVTASGGTIALDASAHGGLSVRIALPLATPSNSSRRPTDLVERYTS